MYKFKQKLKKIPYVTKVKRVLENFLFKNVTSNLLSQIKDLLLLEDFENRKLTFKNPLNRYGRKCFSQADEDGITLEIINRLNIDKGFYIEYGVGDGLENNTLVLATLGWKGFWVGGEDLAFEVTANKEKFSYLKCWIDLKNIVDITNSHLIQLSTKEVDLISIDLDGNDFYFVEELLKSGINPKVFIIEYNAKFPPPIKFKIDYDEKHRWSDDDYFGASLQSFDDLMRSHQYSLVCCNYLTGSNAFYIKNNYLEFFSDVPKNIKDIYMPPKYYLLDRFGHAKSSKVVEKIINQ